MNYLWKNMYTRIGVEFKVGKIEYRDFIGLPKEYWLR